jgi:hypothetical protein
MNRFIAPFTLVLALANFSAAVAADAKNLNGVTEGDAIAAVRSDFDHAKAGEAPACPTSLPASNEILFAFEGCDGYCPVAFLNRLGDVSRNDVTPSFFLSEFGPKSTATELLLSEMEEAEYKESRHHNCALASFIVRNSPEFAYTNPWVLQHPHPTGIPVDAVRSPLGKKILYYAWSQQSEAISCSKQLAALAHRSRQTISISIMGYSLGGPAAKWFYENLPDDTAVKVTNVLTLDPVPRNIRVVGALIRNPGVLSVDTHRPFKAWRNFFQKSDTGSIGFGIRGYRLFGDQNAIRNTWVTPYALSTVDIPEIYKSYGFTSDKMTKYGHEALLFHHEVILEFQRLLGDGYTGTLAAKLYGQ